MKKRQLIRARNVFSSMSSAGSWIADVGLELIDAELNRRGGGLPIAIEPSPQRCNCKLAPNPQPSRQLQDTVLELSDTLANVTADLESEIKARQELEAENRDLWQQLQANDAHRQSIGEELSRLRRQLRQLAEFDTPGPGKRAVVIKAGDVVEGELP